MPAIGGDQRGSAAAANRELARALRDGPFELAVQLTLRHTGLSLDRLAHRLAAQGLRVSASSLSN